MGLLLIFSLPLLALTIPERPVGRVHDQAELLRPSERAELESKLASFEQETSDQIVVATFPSLEGESLEDFSIRLAEKWQIGQKDKDNGIILLIFPNDRQLRIEVGYGLEAVVPDAYASRIIEEKIKPNFRSGHFYLGINQAVEALMNATRGVYEPSRKSRGSKKTSWIVLFLPFLFFSVFLRAISSMRRYGWKKSWGGGSGWTFGHPSWRGGWGSGGGGFGGGGGSFGGGGSSGSW